jgi:hypothetical protein
MSHKSQHMLNSLPSFSPVDIPHTFCVFPYFYKQFHRYASGLYREWHSCSTSIRLFRIMSIPIMFRLFNTVKGKRSVLLYFCYQADSGVPNTSIYSAVFLVYPYYFHFNTVVSNHVNSDHVPSFSCLDVWNVRQTTSGVYAITVITSTYHSCQSICGVLTFPNLKNY